MNNHHHYHHHGDSHKNIALAFLMNFFFMVFEVFAGLLTGSIAVISDSFHDFGDSLSLGVSWVLENKKNKPANEKYQYGFKKLSVIGAIINIFVLTVAIFVSFYHAITRLFNPEEIKTGIVIIVAIVGAIINFIPIIKMKASKTISEKTVSLHLLEDVLGWVALLIVSVIQHFTKWYFLDSCFAIIICLVLILGIVRNCISVFNIIMDSKPSEIDLDKLKQAIKQCDEQIINIISVRVRGIDGESYVADVQLQLINTFSASKLETLYEKINHVMEEYNIEHSTIQVHI